MKLSKRVTIRVGLVWAMGFIAVTHAGVLALPDDRLTQVVSDWLGIMCFVVPLAVCWLAVSRVGFRRWEIFFAAAAVTSFAAGSAAYVAMVVGGGPVPSPSPAEVGFLLVYPLMLFSLYVAVRHHMSGLASSVWLDCAVGSVGAAAVLAVVLSPVLDSALRGSLSWATVVALAIPMFDLALVAAIAGIAVLGGVHVCGRWSLLGAGLVVFAAADAIYVLQVTKGAYVAGTPLDAGWGVGLALIAMWVDGAARPDRPVMQEKRSATGAKALMVSAVASVAGLGVLVLGTQTRVSPLAVALAAMTLLTAMFRTQFVYRQVSRIAQLRRQVATDDLTGLPNRRALYAEGHARLVEPQSRRHALLMLDLDRFKEVNDSLGHHAGDQLLIQVGARLGEHVREGDVLARLGGDEFAVLLEDAGHDEATEVAVKLCAALAESFDLEDITLYSSVSIGIALFPDSGLDLSTLLRKADVAMYKAKTSGHGHHVYSGVDDTDFATRLRMVDELRTALTGDQLVVHYQPKIDLDTGDIRGAEALVRWDHPTRGLLYPDSFLELVEQAGLMRAMTRVVLEIALDQAAAWLAKGQQLTVAVNLSASSLVDTDLPEQVAALLAARDLAPSALQLEITEEFLMADRDRARNILTRLRHSGVQISIDDFGTGYSSLSYLRDLPIDELKLDRSFIFPMADDARAGALVASTIALAHSLGLRMVAEGVETDVAYTELTRLGCDQAQGYFMSRPVPAAELDHWLSTRRLTEKLGALPRLLPVATLD